MDEDFLDPRFPEQVTADSLELLPDQYMKYEVLCDPSFTLDRYSDLDNLMISDHMQAVAGDWRIAGRSFKSFVETLIKVFDKHADRLATLEPPLGIDDKTSISRLAHDISPANHPLQGEKQQEKDTNMDEADKQAEFEDVPLSSPSAKFYPYAGRQSRSSMLCPKLGKGYEFSHMSSRQQDTEHCITLSPSRALVTSCRAAL